MALGRYPEVALADARVRRDAARKKLAGGVDPMAEKTAVKVATEHTFERIGELWLDHWKGNKCTRHTETTRNRLKANVNPVLGERPIAEVEPMDLVRLAKDIEARGASDMAKRILQIVGMVFRYAVAHGYNKRNPAAEIRPSDILKPTTKTNMARIEAKELPELLRSIEVYDGRPLTRLAIKLIALTFVRTSELICARWEEFDFEARRWAIPAARMKMKTPHIVPLSSQAIEVLELLRTISGHSELVFPGEQDFKKPMSNMTILKALERMGYKGRMTGHGLLQCALSSPAASNSRLAPCAMRVAGNRGSSLPHNFSSRRNRTHSVAISRIPSPTGKKYVVKLLLNFVFISHASWWTQPSFKSTCFSLMEAIAESRAPVKSVKATSARLRSSISFPLGIPDIAMAGTSATLLARKWESALLVNVDNDTLRRVLDNPEAMAAVERIEGWRALGENIIETIINKSEKVKDLKNKAKGKDLTEKQKKQLTEEEKEYKSKRKLVQEKLIKFATRIPAFMYLTDFRENTLQDVITRLEPDLFLAVTGLTVEDFHLLVRLKVLTPSK